MSELLKLRLALKAAGFSPIPCKGKQPVLREWQAQLDVSAEEMATWAGANTGSLCAYAPGLDADILDPAAAGAVEEMVKDWFDGRGVIPVRTGLAPKRLMPFRTDTPFPKMAVYFTSPNGDGHKIEILGDGQQAIFSGSHPDTGQPYTWHGGCPGVDVTRNDLVEVTEQEMRNLLQLVSDMLVERFGFERVQRTGGNGVDTPGDEGLERKGPVNIEAELQSMHDGASTNEAHKHIIPSLLRKGEHPADVLKFVVDETMARLGVRLGWTREREVVAVRGRIVSGYNNKLLKDYHPCQGIPPWLPGEFHPRWQEVLDKGGTPMMHFGNVKFCAKAREGSYGTGHKAGDTTSPAAEGSPKPQGKKFVLHAFVPFDLSALPPREWLYGRHYQRHTVSATVAPGGFGKTTLCMVEGVAMATVRNLLGEQPTERLRVWYHNGEDSREELNRRLGAICLHYGIPQEELSGWFFMTSGNEVPLRVANGYGELKIDSQLIRGIEGEIAANKIDVAILDPLVTLHNVSEQDNNRMDTVVRIFAAIADTQSCAIELAHHTRKLLAGSTADYVVDDMRGASAIKDAVRAARMLNQMTEKDAEEVGIPEHERSAYFRVDRVKGNNAPPAKAVWRHFVSVELPNGDDVGVVVPWDFPGHGAPSTQMAEAEKAADHVFLALLTRLTLEGRAVSHKVGPNYAPAVFAAEPEAKSASVGKRRLVDAMRRLFHGKRIRVDVVDRKGREYHVIALV